VINPDCKAESANALYATPVIALQTQPTILDARISGGGSPARGRGEAAVDIEPRVGDLPAPLGGRTPSGGASSIASFAWPVVFDRAALGC
jgi:hypothetical protein